MPDRNRLRVAFLAIVLAAVLGAYAPAVVAESTSKPKSQRILECLATNVPDQGGAATVTITSRSGAGVVTRYRWRLYWREGNDDQRAAVIRVTAPMDVAGSAYLVRQTTSGREVYLYTPSLDAVRRVRSNRTGSRRVFGTDVALRDIFGVARTLANGTLSYMGEKNVNGLMLNKMLALPPPSSNSPYSRIALFIGQGPCVLRRLVFKGNDGLSKRYTAAPESLRQTQSGLSYMAEWTLRDQNSGNTTEIRIDQFSASPNFSAGQFKPQSFYR